MDYVVLAVSWIIVFTFCIKEDRKRRERLKRFKAKR